MAHWLYKSEPFKWSWEMQVAAGAKGTHWDGVRNHLAKQQLLAMKLGDRGFFYHSNEGKEIVGIVEVIKEAYPDPSDPKGIFVMVNLKAVTALKNPVSLAAVKTEPRLAEMALMKFSRLSVQPVTDAEWDIVLEMAGGTR
ncbi:EVE domain-containing protein [Ancylobacter dichloromethanicus]|uniref:Ubiquinol-cytochrome c reductase n=1 Tax=Ancylobacter dichloromethanicus TaxID=518825 RepID=A0A9W6MY63_9HYPH|nr:EVE domain-containing protein [Ancylobacter dichloromethanicus]MBS7555538.1 EVE domain-containing protein [Ancylobacter dichloromethanicus]GLK70736.1 ubiquinol-cytochrome c reductase [Ancylobacter dichloromethanicus]